MVKFKSKVGGETRSFDEDHAQRILDHLKQNPPASWILDDSNFEIIGGKLQPKPKQNDGGSNGGSSPKKDS